jgi:hypothetical protein
VLMGRSNGRTAADGGEHRGEEGRRAGRRRPGLGAALLPLLVVTAIVPAMLALAVGGLIWAPYVTIESTLLQRLVPAPLLGRVFGVRRAVTAAAVPLGAAAGGLLLSHASPTVAIDVSAGTCMLAGAAALCLPALHRIPARRAGAG